MRIETDQITSSSSPATKKPIWVRKNVIGKGCFGTVSLGINRQDGRVFAVKSVNKNSCSPAQLTAIENEISILKSLSSPYIVSYLGDDTTNENHSVYRNLHLEYVSGGTVSDSGTHNEATVRRFAYCLVSALSSLHANGIVHGDIKGRNLLISSTGIAKLADFGTARRANSGRSGPVGSPLWMAPETIRGESQGFEADVWSIGCTVIEMISGKPAWSDEGAETLRRIGYSSESPEMPIGLSKMGIDFVEKCLRREPKKRWSCDQLLRHPFVVGEGQITPRSVLDHIELDDDEEVPVADEGDLGFLGAAAVEERIGKLASTAGAKWESEEGWVEVRGLEMGGVVSENEVFDTWMGAGVGGTRGGEGETCGAEISDVAEEEETVTVAVGGWRHGDGLMMSLIVSEVLLRVILSLLCDTKLRGCDNNTEEMQHFFWYILRDNCVYLVDHDFEKFLLFSVEFYLILREMQVEFTKLICSQMTFSCIYPLNIMWHKPRAKRDLKFRVAISP